MTNPLFPSHIDVFDTYLLTNKVPSYPPHNVYRNGDDNFVIEAALAGYSKEDIEVILHKNYLKIQTIKREHETHDGCQHIGDKIEFMHRGISKRAFELKFKLGNHIEVANVTFKDGLLRVDLTRNVPEDEKPKILDIN